MRYRSLTAKFFIIGAIIFIFIAAFSYTNFRHTESTEDAASKINYAGNLRFRAAEIAWLISRLQQYPDHPDKELLEEEIRYEISTIDQIFDVLEKGSSDLRISPVSSEKAVKMLNEISNTWTSAIKPFFLTSMDTQKEFNNRSIRISDLELHSFIEVDINSFVDLLENEYSENMKAFIRYSYYVISFFVAFFLVTLFFVRKEIIKPILKLKNAAVELDDKFNTDIQISNKDEIGELAGSFVQMSKRVKSYFERLRISEEKTRHIMKILPTGIAVTTPDGRILESNDALSKMLGYGSTEEFQRQPASAHYYDAADRKYLMELINKDRASGIELKLRRRNGKPCWVSVSSTIEKNPSGETWIINALSDITNYKKAKEHTERNYELQTALNQILNLSLKNISLEEILNKVLELILSIPWLSSQQRGAIFLKNNTSGDLEMKASFGLAEPIMNACKTLKPGKCICGRAALSRTIQFVDRVDDQHNTTYEGISPHGHYCVPILSNKETSGVINIYLNEGHPFSEQEAMFLTSVASTLAGIIEHKQTEKSLIESEYNLKALFNATDDMVVMIEKNGTIVAVNKEIKNRFGIPLGDAVGKTIFNILPPDLAAQRKPHVMKVLETKQPHRFQDTYKDRSYDNSLFPVFDAGGGIRRIAVFSKDITKLKLTEQKLKLQTKELMALADAFNTISAVTLTENIYEAICDIAVRSFNIKMAWFGEPLAETHEVKPVASAGGENGYLSYIKVKYDDSDYGKGPSGRAIKTKQPSILNDIDTESFRPWKAEALKRGYRSSMAMPLLDSDANVMGVLNIYSDRTDYFDREKVHLFALYANYAAIALENRVIVDGLENKVMERTAEIEDFGGKLHKLYELSYATGRNTMGFTKMILNELVGILRVDTAVVTNFKKGKTAFLAISEPNSLGLEEGMELPMDNSFCGIVSDTRGPLIINDTLASRNHKTHPCYTDQGIRSYLGVPIFVEKKLTGTLCSFSRSPHAYNNYDVILHQLLSKRLEFEFTREKYENRLRKAMINAESASRAKSEFLANMSHELRTPLNTIIGFSEMINDGMTGEINNKQKDFLADIIGSSKHLLSLINDILDMSKVEAGKMELHISEHSLTDIANSCMSMFREKALKQQIKAAVSIEEDAKTVAADERKLKQILFNLLSNAFKFTPDNGHITLKARKVSGGEKNESILNDYLEISVTDTGQGISAQDQKRLFRPFEQLEGPYENKHEGTGLGLALCKKLAELHGGSIHVQSEPGRGSTFSIRLPADNASI